MADNTMRVADAEDGSYDDALRSANHLDDASIIMHTKLDLELQLEAGKITHSRTITVVALGCIAIIVIYNILNFFVFNNNALLLMTISFGPCILLFIAGFWGYQPLIMIKSYRQMKKHQRWPEYLISFNSQELENYSYISGHAYLHQYSEINSVNESSNLIVITSEKSLIVMNKNDFIKGSLEELRKLLKEKLRAECFAGM